MNGIRYFGALICASVNFLCWAQEARRADFVVFSYDRPMQLYALLESVQLYVTGLGQSTVIYRASEEKFDRAYQEVADNFPGFTFCRQGAEPHKDFKPLTVHAVLDTPNEYILFAVDDIIVKDFFDVSAGIDLVERYGAYGLYYRLGLHLNYCHPQNREQRVPVYRQLEQDLCEFYFCDGECDWGYPHTVDMTLYRKKDIAFDIQDMTYKSPNTFEGRWAQRTGGIMNRSGLFYAFSKMVNIPLNKVQRDYNNRHMNLLSVQELLDLFNQKLKIDISLFHKIINNGAHTEYAPTFVSR